MNKFQSIAIILALFPLMGAQSASTIERSQELIQEDKALRQEIGREQKLFVKAIILKGALKLPQEETKGIIAPFQGQWLTKKNIQQIIDSLKAVYAKKGAGANRIIASYELKEENTLEITFNELTK